jgi:hypothetical protein
MSVYAEASKAERKRIRKTMLELTSSALEESHPDAAQRRAIARSIVDEALANEMRTANEPAGVA